jgi:hypothetical protein
MALLAAIGIGVGVEAALGVGQQPVATSGTVTGVVRPTGWTGYAPLPGPSEIHFYLTAGGRPPQPTLTVRVSSAGRFVAHLQAGQYLLTGLPCGPETVEVRPGTAQNVSFNCKAVLVPAPG